MKLDKYSENIMLTTEKGKLEKEYWTKKLAGEATSCGFLRDINVLKSQEIEYKTTVHKLSKDVCQSINKLSKKSQYAIYMILLTAVKYLLHKYTSNNDITIGMPTLIQKGKSENSQNILALRTTLEEDESFKSLLVKIRSIVLEADKNQNFPLGKTAELLDLQQENNKYRFSTIVELDSIHNSNILSLVNADMLFSFALVEDNIQLKLSYDNRFFNDNTINRIINHMSSFLLHGLKEFDTSLSQIDILSENEKNQVINEFNNTATDYPRKKTIQQLFEEQVEHIPDNVAVVFEDKDNRKVLTYKQLNEKSNQLAKVLRSKGLRANEAVGIMVERSLEMIVGILAILKAGGAYLPIDSEYPVDRIQHMLEDSSANILLTQSWLSKDGTGNRDIIELDNEDIYTGCTDNLDSNYKLNDKYDSPIAYIMYTSGSTGKPKGAVIEHKSVVRLVKNTNYIAFQKDDRILLTGAIVFDACTFEFWGALLNGLELFIVDKNRILDAIELEKAIVSNKITILWLTSSLFNQIAQQKAEIFSSLRYLLAGGDVLSPKNINEVKNRCKDIKIVNGYGPTENTTFSVCYLIDKEYEFNIPIGKPIANSKAYIVDKLNKPCPIGVPGELCVAGDGLARGYLNRPELTLEKFVENPFAKDDKMYRTGDLARWLEDGNIEFLGRIDHQIKMRGFRIELGEIESHLRKHEDIKEVLVMAKDDENGDKYLCAYVVVEDELNEENIKDYLSKNLPHYMVPAYFIKMDIMPLTVNGKIDRKALPEVDKGKYVNKNYVAPRNSIEEKVVSVWQEVLGINKIGIKDNFFELGGDSIKAIQVLSRLNKYRLKFEIKDLFLHKTIEKLSKVIVKSEMIQIEQGEIKGEVNLTPIQKWFFEKQFTNMNHWNQSTMLHGKNGFEIDKVKEVFNKIVHHHDALRMIYKEDESIIQYNRDTNEESYTLDVLDFTNEDNYKEKIEEEANRIQRGINLEKGPLVKLGLFKTKEGDHLLIAIHHLVIDGVSWRIIFEDFTIGYNQLLKGEDIKFQYKTHSFKEWSQRLKKYSQSKELKKEKDYWSNIESVDISSLPVDKNETEASKLKDIDTVQLSFTEDETQKLLKQVNKAYNTEINDILLTALGITIKEWTSNNRVLVSLEGHGREDIIKGMDITRTVGWFTSQYPVLLDSTSENISYLIRNTKEYLKKIPNKGMGYSILKYMTMDENIHFTSNPEISFNYLGQFGQDVNTDLFNISQISTGDTMSMESENMYKLNINGMIAKEKLVMAFSYSKNQYNQSTIDKLIQDYRKNLVSLIKHCVSIQKPKLTPEDVGCKDLTIEQFDSLEEIYGDNIKSIYGLSPTQEGMLFYAMLDNQSSTYFQQITFLIEGYIDAELLERSFNKVIERHDILRTNFISESLKRPLQVVLKENKIKVHFEDISHLGNEKANDYIEEYKLKDKDIGFDLSKDSLVRLAVIKYGENAYKFIWSFHHIVMDGWCLGVINRELFEAYTAFKNNKSLEIKVAPKFRSYIDWLDKQDEEEAREYWSSYLEGYENSVNIPQTKVSDSNDFIREELKFVISEEVTEKINAIAKKNNTTPNIVLQSIWGLILQRYNNTNDVIFGAVLSGRRSEIEDIEDIVGLFINTVPVRVNCTDNMLFTELLDKMQKSALDSEKYSYYPLVKIQGMSSLKNTLIQQIMVFENYPIERTLMTDEDGNDIGFAFIDSEVFQQTNYDFEMAMFPGKDIIVRFTYNGAIYSKWFMESIAEHITEAAEAIAKSQNIVAKDIEFIPTKDKSKILYDFNDTKADYPKTKNIQQIFEEQVERTPNNIALIYEDKQLTYKELNEKANQLARVLISKGTNKDVEGNKNNIIAIMAERSLEMVIGIIAIIKAGAAYLPIDANYPEDRINFMIEDSEAKAVLCQSWLRDRISTELEIIDLDVDSNYQGNTNNINNNNSPEDLLYIIYTSGTTGKPKGVMLEHRNIVRLMFNDKMQFDFTDKDVWTMFHSFCFDFSVWEMYGALLYGGRLVVVPRIIAQQPKEYLELLKKEKVTVLNQTPTAFYNLVNEELEYEQSSLVLRYVIFGGEALKPIKLKEWKEKYNNTKLINMYGITETTVHVTYKEITENEINNNISNIGVPIPTLTAYILDKNMKLLPIGVAGELCVGGDGVARGYINRPELTAQKFVMNPYKEDERLYRSGDLVKMLPNGDMEYLGRIDHQVKIRGHRIELGEIENKLLKEESIEEAVVLAKEDRDGNKFLCAYIISKEKMTIKELREYMSQDLPDYMLPSYFVQLEEMPLTSNGKIDKKALPQPDGSISLSTEYVAPTTEIEKNLADTWKEVLGVDTVGIKNSFFELGGDSIKAIQVVSRLNKYNLKMNIKDLFQHNTIEELAMVVTKIDDNQVKISLEQFVEGYMTALEGKDIVYKDKNYTFKDWMSKLNTDVENKEIQKELKYWNRLNKIDIKPLPADNENISNSVDSEVDFIEIYLSIEETEKLLNKANRAYNTHEKDIILTALGLSIKEWIQDNKVLININENRNESIVREIGISKTGKNLDLKYPLLLDMKEADISYLLRIQKEEIRKVPNKSLGYGILKYLLSENEIELNNEPEICFEYVQNKIIKSNNNKNSNEADFVKLNIKSGIVENRLTTLIEYNSKQYKKETIQNIADSLIGNMNMLIEHCVSRYSVKNETKLTPYDVGCKELTIREFDKISEAWNNKIQGIYSLTSTQVGMLFYTMLDKVSHAYFEQACFTIRGGMDVQLFRESFRRIVERHDALRTNFIYKDVINPLQAVILKEDTDIYYEDISELDEESRNRYLEEFKEKDKERGFDLEKDTLIRFSVIKTEEDVYEIVWSFHHIVMDGWCIHIINKEFFDIYYALKTNVEPKLGPVAPFKDYIYWLEKQDEKEAKEFWAKYMDSYDSQAEMPKTKLKTDKYKREEIEFVIGKTVTNKLTNVAKNNNSTINTVIQAIWGVLLQRYNNTDDVVFGLITSGRNSHIKNIEEMVGLFINTIPVRVQSQINTTFTELLAKMQESAFEAENHSYYPLADILAVSTMKGSLVDNALFDHILVFENFNPEKSIISDDSDSGVDIGFTAENVTIFEQTNFDFSMDILPAEEIVIKCIYNAEVFAESFIISVCNHIEEAAKKVIETPSIPISEIQFISNDEKEKMLDEFNNNKMQFPKEKTVYELFEEQVKKTPNSIAVKCGQNELTYKQLNEKSNQLARVLKEKGLEKDNVVGILAERSIEMLLGIMAVFKAGGAYLPVDSEYPEDRKKYMLEDSNVKIVLTQSHLMDDIDIEAEKIDLQNKKLYEGDGTNLDKLSGPADLAYVIYTSGSTGRPKGAMVEHVGMVNHIYAKINDLNANENSIIAQNSSHCFDISVWQFLTALIIGGQTVIYPNDVVLDVGRFIEQVIDDNLTILEVVPSYLAAVLDHIEVGFKKFETLEYILVTGETVKPNLVKRWFEKYPKIMMVNAYGPTEASDDITHCIMSEAPTANTIPIGKPIQNMTIYIVDEKMNLCPIGIKGQVCVSGIGVGRGYINDIEKTKQKFIDDPFSSEKGVRLYKTGDLGRWLEDGNIEFFGRMDYQVKIRGFRIELEEIEKALTTYEAIKEAVVIDKENASGDKYLSGYFVANGQVDIAELKKFLLEALPDYMVPAYLMQLENLPLTPNGKVNRKALPEPEGNISISTEYIAPRNETEENIAKMWQDILDVEPIGIEHNFFELGGNSLKLISLVSKVYETFDVELSHKQLFENPTIKEIANILIEGDYKEQNPLALLNAKTDKNVFLFPPIGGYGLVYKDLADVLYEYSWYSFNYIEDDNYDVSSYIRYIIDTQKEGPYVLAGWSAGGNLAFEVAKEMEKQGYEVSDVIVIDVARLMSNMNYSKQEILDMVNGNLGLAMEDEFYKDYLSKNEFIRKRVAVIMEHYMTYYNNHMINSGKVNADIHILLSTQNPEEGTEDGRMYWDDSTTGRFIKYQGVGEHAYMLYAGQVEENAKILKEILDKIF